MLKKYDLVVATTGNINVLDKYMLDALKSGCVVCNIGHFDNEIDVKHLKTYDWYEVKPGVHKVIRGKDDYLLLLGEGRLVGWRAQAIQAALWTTHLQSSSCTDCII